MLERIQKSREPATAHENNDKHDRDRDRDRENNEANTNTTANTTRDGHETGVYYIGNNHDHDRDEDNVIPSPRFAGFLDNDHEHDAPPLFEEDEQIFELDL
jgi:hypothetical protein